MIRAAGAAVVLGMLAGPAGAEESLWTDRSAAGKHAVLTELFAVLRQRIEGRIKMIAQRILADGDFVVVEARGDNVTKTGARYDNSYCFVFRLAGGKLAEVTEYMRRIAIQNSLQRSEAQKAAVLDAALDCITSMDASGLIVAWNAAGERMLPA